MCCAFSPSAASMAGAISMLTCTKIGQQTAHLLEGTFRIFAGELQHFFGTDVDAFVPFFQFFQQGGALGQTAELFAPAGQFFLAGGMLAARFGQIVAGGLKFGNALVAAFDQFLLPLGQSNKSC